MARLGTILQVVPAEVFTSSSTSGATVGDYGETPDGRGFRYVQNGATAAVPGNLFQSAPEITVHQGREAAAAAIGDTILSINLGANAAEADEYADGFVVVTSNAAEGQSYGIIGHSAVASSGTLVATLSDPVKVAITAASRVDLVKNPYRHVVVNPTTATGSPVGVALHAIGATEYGWLQTHGPSPVRAKAAIAVGFNFVASTGQAGAVSPLTEDKGAPVLGYALTGIADSEFGVGVLTID